MKNVAEVELLIDLRLRFVFFGIQCTLNIALDIPEIEKAFRDSKEGQIAEKTYVFYNSSRLKLTASTGDYEPETMLLKIEGSRQQIEIFQRVIQESAYQLVRIERAEEGV